MLSKMTRRSIVKGGLIAGALIPAYGLIGNRAAAAGLPALDPSDATAKSLGFVTDATTVSAAANPTYKPGQKCASCAQFQGKPTDASAACTIFTGHSVPAGGWCKVYAPKPAA